MKRFPVILAIALGTAVYADSPLRPPSDFRICDHFTNYCAHLSTTEGTTVYRITGKFQSEELYSVEGWHRDAHLSPDGRYFVAGFDGLNLVPQDVSPEQIMVSIFDRGKLVHEVRLKQLFNSLDSLRRTISHLEWGWIGGVTTDAVILETTEGDAYIKLETGKVYLPRPSSKEKPEHSPQQTSPLSLRSSTSAVEIDR
jgi:hypothetical protein